MAEESNESRSIRDPNFSNTPEFYRRVLEHVPAPLMVVNPQAEVIYANRALLRLGNWDYVKGQSVLNFVHPDDHHAVSDAFSRILESPNARILGSGRQWSEIRVRVRTPDGTIIPIEIVGNGGVLDDVVGGIIYAIRPVQTEVLVANVLEGMSEGAPLHQLLSIVCQMIAKPPLDLDGVILESTPDGTYHVAASTSLQLAEALAPQIENLWDKADTTPTSLDGGDLPTELHDRLLAMGFTSFWQIAVDSPLTPTTLRIFCASATEHNPDSSTTDRMLRAREVAAAILLRTQSAVLLDYAAGHDDVTDFPNRAAFYQLADALDRVNARGALHVDVAGLQVVVAELGQASGDAALGIVADRLRACIDDDDVVGRVNDNEFSILLSSDGEAITLADRTVHIATTIREAVREPIIIAGRPLNISTSIGVAIAEPGVSTGELLAWAHAALQDAKAAGGDRIFRFGVSFG